MVKSVSARKPFNLMLNDKEREILDNLKTIRSISAGQVLRDALQAAHSHAHGAYCCGNGEMCLVPSVHHARKQQ